MRMVNEKSHIAGGMKRNKESALMADSNITLDRVRRHSVRDRSLTQMLDRA
jgi:hypothetical protein